MAPVRETLHAKKRQASGTKACRRLRAAGEVPAVVYGHKEETVMVQVLCEELQTAMRHHSRVVDLDIEGRTESVVLKDVQFDALGAEVVHADFLRVAMDEAISLEVRILLKGTLKQEHAVLQQMLGRLEIECLPGNIPEVIIGLVGDLQIGQPLHVADLVVPEGVKVLTDPETVVATVTAAKAEAVEEAAVAEAPAAEEPELIGRKKEAEEAEEDESK